MGEYVGRIYLMNKNKPLFIIDYGNFDKTMKNTLQSISKHKYNNVLNNFGQSDITYSINFKPLKT